MSCNRGYSLTARLTACISPSEPNKYLAVRQVIVMLLVVAFLATGSGAFSSLHAHQHVDEHSHALSGSDDSSVQPSPSTGHSEWNCSIFLSLHTPLFLATLVLLFICVGALPCFRHDEADLLFSQPVELSFDCRGPPATA